jgi:hypothetical protein
MILDKKIKIRITSNVLKYYKQFYDVKNNDIIEIDIKHLHPGSGIKVNVECDVCKAKKYIPYRQYMKSFKNGGYYTCSSKCSSQKKKETYITNYGTEHYMKTEEGKNKISKMWSDGSIDIDKRTKKTKKTLLKKYGDESYVANKKYIQYENSYLGLKCEKCGKIYKISNSLLSDRRKRGEILCTNCNKLYGNVSKGENEIYDFIKSIYNGDIIKNNRTILNGDELDIFIAEKNFAIEYNGLYWHSSAMIKFKDYSKEFVENRHKIKTDECEKQNIELFHIFEDSWVNNKDLIKSMIINKLGLTTNKIYARKTIIKEIKDIKLIREFLNANHIQGFTPSKIKIGLFYNDELVSLMLFDNKNTLVRFCNKKYTNVVGGGSKLLNYYEKKYKPSEIKTYADRTYSNGSLYYTLGFTKIKTNKPSYYYVINKKRYHKSSFMKYKLVEMGFDKNKTEFEIMNERKIHRIYNSGIILFKKIIKK